MLVINNQIKTDTTEIVLIVVIIMLSTYSLLKYGYQIWFQSAKFLSEAKESKQRSPNWLKFFANLTSVETDLLIAKTIFFLGLLSVIAFVGFLILKIRL